VDDILLVQNPEYKEYIYNSLIEEVFSDTIEGTCHLCGENKKITSDTTRFWFKFYMTDKLGFSSNFLGDKGFIKNYALCKNCYEKIIVAEAFIRNNLSSYLSGYSVYIIPSLHLGSSIPVKKIEGWAEYFKGKFNAISRLKDWHEFQKKLEDYFEYQELQDYFMLNFLFAEKKQSAFKVHQLIQDVPPSRLDELLIKNAEINDLAAEVFEGSRDWYLSLEKMFYLFPMSKTKEKRSKFILQLYNSLFTGLPVSYTVIIKQFVKRIYEMRFEKNYDDFAFCWNILHQGLLLYYLKQLELLKGGNFMGINLDEFPLSENIKKFLKESQYSEQMLSLFLLGCTIGKIGKVQHDKGDKKKSILNKINFLGMDLNKILRLFNEVYEKMRQYKVLSSEAEKVYGLSKLLFDKCKNTWNLTPQENVFYILSGYAFTTYKVITSSKQKEETKEEIKK